jgi:DNA-binding XRE family transcriptional regulator
MITRQEFRESRCKLGLSQAGLGAAIGVSASQVYSMEAGRREIGLCVELALRYRRFEAGQDQQIDQQGQDKMTKEMWTVARYPNGDWSAGGKPTDQLDMVYSGCEIYQIEAPHFQAALSMAKAVRKAQAKRDRQHSPARTASKDRS